MSTPTQEIALEPAPFQGPSRGKRVTRGIISWFHIIIVTASMLLCVFFAVPLFILVYIAEVRRLRRKPDEYTRYDERFRSFNLLLVRAYIYMFILYEPILRLAGGVLFVVWAIAKLFGLLSWFDDDEDLEALRLRAEATVTPVPTSVPVDDGLARTKLNSGWKAIRAILSIFHFLTAITLLVFSVFAIIDSKPSMAYPGIIYIQIFAILIIIAETRRFRPQRTDVGPRDPRVVAFDDLFVRGVLYQLTACLIFSAERRMSSLQFPASVLAFVILGIGVFFCLLWAFAKLVGFLSRLQGEEDEGNIRLEESSEDVQDPTATA